MPLRAYPEVLAPILAPRLGDAYPALFAETFAIATAFHPDEPDVVRALVHPALDRGRLVGDEAVRLGAMRAERFVEAGLFARAEREAERVVRDADLDRPAQRAAAHAAWIAQARAMRALASPRVQAALAEAAAVAPSPELHEFMVRRHFTSQGQGAR